MYSLAPAFFQKAYLDFNRSNGVFTTSQHELLLPTSYYKLQKHVNYYYYFLYYYYYYYYYYFYY
ncbi:hypothetical protein DPMN_164262 [Dreissena polymorpha]|uniref:Uncharacterized protein n=1 Tax=Dreissena polymorpha TaxID=45954 RepID=A0A9D4ESK7_DREPO|nr:hypothetical protein DPMN_164262 [Dreissena polymorpha]